ncbi:MAG: hypothetical protein M3R22_07890, partial [Pseudomonadota bacterium]|nr:hypothetical protein [Pseudomonadota bacterium]
MLPEQLARARSALPMPHSLLPRFLLAVALAAATAAARAEGPVTEPPVAPLHPVTDTYWGQKVADPYQWMEDEKSPEFQSWMKGQNDYARTVLARIPGRNALRDRIAALSNAGTTVYQVQTAALSYFY